ncbi:hypothetical protein BSR28_01960 [Boudabousia liubingyangii]|uniref:glycosyltransferase n=1 Tax=Boudabousia liubingyangii TaxID=1921764 RepID=UPI00093CACDA|nr:glycosyltransferase [Boudabousia liubingyangii]OKL48483.1 hypothetical protein BSR28_01960 [Boudabousia liubingyangii]
MRSSYIRNLKLKQHKKHVVLANQLVSLVGITRNHLLSDPASFLVQIIRRLPLNTRQKFISLLRTIARKHSLLELLYYFVSDLPEQTQKALKSMPPSRIRDAIAVAEKVSLPDMSGTYKAKLAWTTGDFDKAIALSEGKLKKKYKDEIHLIEIPEDFIGECLNSVKNSRSVNHTNPSGSIYIATNSFPYTSSGYAIRTQELLSAWSKDNIPVTAITRIAYPLNIGYLVGSFTEDYKGVKYLRDIPKSLPSYLSRKLIKHFQFVYSEVLSHSPSAIISTTDFQNGLVGLAVAQATNLPFIYEMRGQLEDSWLSKLPEDISQKARSKGRYPALKELETWIANKANMVVVLSCIQADDLVKRGIPRSKIYIAPNGISQNNLLKGPSNLKQRYANQQGARLAVSLPLDRFIFGSISSVVPYEGLERLVWALNSLRNEGINAHLLIVGDGVALPSIRNLAASLQLTEFCTFTGRIPQDKTMPYYHSLDVFCVPRINSSVTRNITPLKSLPALASGVPTLVSNLPALKTVVPNKYLELLTVEDDDDAWKESLIYWFKHLTTGKSSLNVSDAIKPNAESTMLDLVKFAESRTWKRIAEDYYTVIEQVILKNSFLQDK